MKLKSPESQRKEAQEPAVENLDDLKRRGHELFREIVKPETAQLVIVVAGWVAVVLAALMLLVALGLFAVVAMGSFFLIGLGIPASDVAQVIRALFLGAGLFAGGAWVFLRHWRRQLRRRTGSSAKK